MYAWKLFLYDFLLILRQIPIYRNYIAIRWVFKKVEKKKTYWRRSNDIFVIADWLTSFE